MGGASQASAGSLAGRVPCACQVGKPRSGNRPPWGWRKWPHSPAKPVIRQKRCSRACPQRGMAVNIPLGGVRGPPSVAAVHHAIPGCAESRRGAEERDYEVSEFGREAHPSQHSQQQSVPIPVPQTSRLAGAVKIAAWTVQADHCPVRPWGSFVAQALASCAPKPHPGGLINARTMAWTGQCQAASS